MVDLIGTSDIWSLDSNGGEVLYGNMLARRPVAGDPTQPCGGKRYVVVGAYGSPTRMGKLPIFVALSLHILHRPSVDRSFHPVLRLHRAGHPSDRNHHAQLSPSTQLQAQASELDTEVFRIEVPTCR